jgi:hypothetical protein
VLQRRLPRRTGCNPAARRLTRLLPRRAVSPTGPPREPCRSRTATAMAGAKTLERSAEAPSGGGEREAVRGGPQPPAPPGDAARRRPAGRRGSRRRRPESWGASRPHHARGGQGFSSRHVQPGGPGGGMPDEGRPHPQPAHDHPSADATWRPRGAGTAGARRGMTASSGPIAGAGPGRRTPPMAAWAGSMA